MAAIRIYAHSDKQTQIHTHTLSHTHSNTHPLSLTHTNTHTHIQTHTLSLSHAHTHTYTLSLPLALFQTHTVLDSYVYVSMGVARELMGKRVSVVLEHCNLLYLFDTKQEENRFYRYDKNQQCIRYGRPLKFTGSRCKIKAY